MKDYLITFVRLLLGIDQAVGSGHLSSVSTHLHISEYMNNNCINLFNETKKY